MHYLIYKSTDLLDCMLRDDENTACRYVVLTDRHLKSRLFNWLITQTRTKNRYIPWLFRLAPGFRQLRSIEAESTVIIFDIADIELIEYIRLSIPKNCRIHAFYWNPLSKTFPCIEPKVAKLKAMGCSISTFDKHDAETYQLEYKNQFIRQFKTERLEIPRYDFYFLGVPKGREGTLQVITQSLEAIGKKGICIVPKSKAEMILYEANVRHVWDCRCLIEILQEGQTGITLRALEALVYRKKLITTCQTITDFDFYKPQNILIWNNQSQQELADFMNTDMEPVNEKTISKYSLHTWITSFK